MATNTKANTIRQALCNALEQIEATPVLPRDANRAQRVINALGSLMGDSTDDQLMVLKTYLEVVL